MEFKIEELDKKRECFEINEKTAKDLKNELKTAKFTDISVGFEYLSLGTKLYGDGKKASIKIQQENCKKVIDVYKACKKAVKLIKKLKIEWSGVFYIDGLKDKKNNNDLMLIALLDTHFNYNIFKRLGSAVHYSCDYLDKENEINNMCDFKDNKCVKHRELNIDKKTGCCPSFCKYVDCKVCNVKNLSCKIFMCNFLEDRGYYFTPHTIPVLKKHLNIVERFMCFGLLFKTTKKTISRLWFIRVLLALAGVVISASLVMAVLAIIL